MKEHPLQIEHTNLHAQICVAWSILLLEYSASSATTFAIRNAFPSPKGYRSIIPADIGCDKTVKDAIRAMEHHLCNPQEAEQSDSQSKFHSEIWLPTAVSKRDSALGWSVVEYQQNSTAAPPATPNLIVKCTLETILHNQTHVLVAVESRGANASSHQNRRMQHQLEHLLRQMSVPRNQSRSIQALDKATPQDIHDIWTWNAVLSKAATSTTWETFQVAAMRNPQAQAIDSWDGCLTYLELHELSSKLAESLISLGAQRNVIVPCFFEKSLWTSVATLALSKTGAAFSLIDPNLPHEGVSKYVERITSGGSSSLVLSSYSEQHRANLISSNVVLVGHSTRRLLERGSTSTLYYAGSAQSSDPVYVTFTSGSTGLPKAVVTHHENLCTFVTMHAPVNGIVQSSRILDYASYAFDVSMSNMFLALLTGACLCIPSSWDLKNSLSRAVDKHHITYAEMTPSASSLLDPKDCTDLQVLNLGGECLKEADLAKWKESAVRVMNSYGPAECTITSVVNPNAKNSGAANIGKGLGTNTWVVNPVNHEQLSPVGAIGELALEGPLVGAGYYRDNKSMETAFKDNPGWLVSGCPGVASGRLGRLYFTGDLVRYQEDGSLLYVGRRDSQVKIRGQRIELAEITMAIERVMPPTVSFRVEPVQFRNESQLLVAFVQCKDSNHEELRKSLRQVDEILRASLSSWKVPSGYFFVDTMPLTLSGKIDSAKLKQTARNMGPDKMLIIGQNDDIACSGQDHAKNEIQAKLLQLWSDILDIDLASVREDETFFSHGGDSLAAIKLANRAISQGLSLSVAAVLRYPRLSEMALHCKEDHGEPLEVVERFALLGDTMPEDELLEKLEIACSLSAGDIEDAYPCTPMQEGLILTGFERSGAYVGEQVIDLPDHVDPVRFEQAWKTVCSKHEILRTRIVDTNTWGLIQVVLKEDHDQALSQGNASSVLGLGTPLCRWSMTADPTSARTRFTLKMHHAIYDGWTLPYLAAEVFKIYQGIPVLPSPKFNLFIKHALLSPPSGTKEFWTSKLARPEETSFFPIVPSDVPNIRADATLTKFIPIVSKTHPVTSTASLVRAAWVLLFSKFLGSEDVTIGATVSGRNVPIAGIENMPSPTIATVPVRTKIDYMETTENYVRRIQNEAVDAMPFENFGLQNIKKLSFSTKKGSAFQTLLVVQPPDEVDDTAYAESPTVQELWNLLSTMDVSKVLSNFNSFALMLLVNQVKGGILVETSFDSRVLNTPQMHRILDQFTHVLHQLSDERNINRELNEISIISDSDLNTIFERNREEIRHSQNCIHGIFHATLLGQPDAQAVCAWDGCLTYRELDQISSNLTRNLKSKGIGSGDIIPICMEKSMWVTVAMLAIIKSGAAFVAMDVRHQPIKRLQTIVDQVAASYIITAGPAKNIANELSGNVIRCDELCKTLEVDDDEGYVSPLTCEPSTTAFVVFTSGSTGIPKGIVITHENFATNVSYYAEPLDLNYESRVYDYASYSFDVGTHNTLSTLMIGGCLCIPSEDDRENNIEESMERLRANWVHLTPSVARILSPLQVPTLKTLVLGGEAPTKDLILQWSPTVNVIGAYGPAECQYCLVQAQIQNPADCRNIGRSMGCKTWVLEPGSECLAPIGAIGELAIEGPIVSPGYLHAPSSEHPAWLHNPHWLLNGFGSHLGRNGSMYRTGDLVQYQPDGTLVYMGRATNQVKLNGQRIELDEIEYHLRRSQLKLKDVAVEMIIINEMPKLAAFLLFSDASATPSVKGGDLELYPTTVERCQISGLEENLPAIMIPSLFFEVSHMPLTPTRKLDRRQLRQYASTLSSGFLQAIDKSSNGFGDTEADELFHRLQKIWAKVLSLEFDNIGLYSDFFQLGGDSIAAMRLARRAKDIGISFKVSDVTRNSRMSDLVACCRQNQSSEPTPESHLSTLIPFALMRDSHEPQFLIASAAKACGLSESEIVDIYPCTPMQEGLFAMTSLDPSAYVQKTKITIRSDAAMDRVITSWNSIVAATDILRTRIISLGGPALFQVVVSASLEWRWYDDYDQFARESSSRTLTFGSPLSQFAVIRTNQASPLCTIVWTLHHALYDSSTMELILNDVERFYQTDEVPQSPRYSTFVQHVLNQNKAGQQWWQSFVSEAKDAIVFPHQLKEESATTKSEFHHACKIPDIRPAGYTVASLARAAWAILIAQVTGCEKVIFGGTVSGRETPIPSIESLRGPTIATVPILVKVDRDITVQSFLESIREDSIRTQPFEHFGLQNIAKLSNEAKATCNFKTLLVMQSNDEVAELERSQQNPEAYQAVDTNDDTRNFSSYPLLLVLTPRLRSLEIDAVYSEEVLDASYVQFIVERLSSLFQQLCTTPLDVKLDYFDTAESNDLEQIWQSNRDVPESVDGLVHKIFQERAAQMPDQIIVDAHDGHITFRQLDQFSSKLASLLQTTGVGLGSFVPLCFEKSVWVTVCQLAIIKAGAAFAFMDVSHPQERLFRLAEALDAPVILASISQSELAATFQRPVITVGDEYFAGREDVAPLTSFDKQLPSDSDRPICISCTSGSTTGTPKIVVYSHRNIVSALAHQLPMTGIAAGTRIFDFVPYAFDIAVWNAVVVLVSGACLCVPSQWEARNAIHEAMNKYRIDTTFFIPSMARTIDPSRLPTLKSIVLGGEAITPLDISQWKDYTEVIGFYGPTECTPVSLISFIQNPEDAKIIGIGAATIPWVVRPDDHHQLVKTGVVGELMIEGPGVAGGYHKEPDKTENAFISQPRFLTLGSKNLPGRTSVLYKTGDLVRRRHDGLFEFIGRAGTQAKLRGQRVDFGEIASQIKLLLPEAKAYAIDIVAHQSTGRQVLVAYCELDRGTLSSKTSAVKDQLKRKLPLYMVPETFVPLDKLPLMANGKLNRKALEAMGPELLQHHMETLHSGNVLTGPLTEKESILLELWAAATGRDELPPCPNSDFFEVGGDSISAMTLSSLARDRDIALPVRVITITPQLCDMALSIPKTNNTPPKVLPFTLLPLDNIACVVEAAARIAKIPKDTIVDIYPCSPMQIELFSITMAHPELYIRRCIFEVPENIDLDRLVRAWETVIELNDILRARFVELDAIGLVQIITKESMIGVTHDLEKYLGQGKDKVDFGSPLSNLVTYRDGNTRKLIWTVHHAIYDEWTIFMIEEQLRKAYKGERISQSPGYNMFVSHVASQDSGQAEQFWTERLAGAKAEHYPSLPTPNYFPRPSAKHNQNLSVKTTMGISLQTTIYAAWALIVSEITQTTDIIFAATLSGRDVDVPHIEHIAGPTITSMPIRVQIIQDHTVDQLMRQIQDETTASKPYQLMGLGKISAINADTRAACNIETYMTILSQEEMRDKAQSEIQIASYEVESEQGDPFYNNALSLFFIPKANGLEIEAEFDPRVLSPREVARLAGRLEQVMNQLSQCSKDESLRNIYCVGNNDLEDIWRWNSAVPEATEKPLHEIMLESVKRWPDNTAIHAWNLRMTFFELDTYSFNLSQRLQQILPGKGSVVPILSEKSGYAPAAVLAILRAGAAFVPLDASQPLARLKSIVDQLNPTLILTTIASKSLAQYLAPSVVLIDSTDLCSHDQATRSNPMLQSVQTTPDDMACIMFTSGTTGIPKGGILTHRVLSSAVTHQMVASGYNAGTKVYDFSSYAFDVSWDNMFKVLSAGGCLCVPSEDERKNDLLASMNRFQATMLQLTPSVARLLQPEQLPSVETLILCGEAVDLRQFRHWSPSVQVITTYSPSECSSSSLFYYGTEATLNHPIGKPIGCATWIVNPEDHTRLVPVGSVGELVIEGPLCGAGYYNDPSKTSSSFVTDLPWLEAGIANRTGRKATVYKTGDLVRYDSEGTMYFVSRKDHQVKIRGQRVELEEIAYHVKKIMADHVNIVSVSVASIASISEREVLIAFLGTGDAFKGECHIVAPTPEALTTLRLVQDGLQDAIPVHMIPDAYVFVSTIPLSPNGKVDQKHLVQISQDIQSDHVYRSGDEREAHSTKPSTQLEQELLPLWASVLGLKSEAIDAHDNFFHQGGNSITVMRLVSLLRAKNHDLRVADVMNYPRFSDLACRLESRERLSQTSRIFQPFELLGESVRRRRIQCEASQKCDNITATAIEDAYPSTPLQASMVAATIKNPGDFVSTNVYKIPSWVDLVALRDAWADVVARNPILRTRFVDLTDFGLTQIIVNEHIDWKVRQVSNTHDNICKKKSMGLGSRLTSWDILENDNGDRKLVWTIHHALYDAWSLAMIERQVYCYYFEQTNTIQSLDMRLFVHYIKSNDKARMKDYWAQELANSEEVAHFPSLPSIDYVPHANLMTEVTIVQPSINHLESTLSSLLYASWALLVSRISASSDIAFGTILSGRNIPVAGIESIMGPTITTIPLRIRLDGSQRVEDFVQGVQKKMTSLIPHEHLGIPNIRRINTTCNSACNFQTVLVIQPGPNSLGDQHGHSERSLMIDSKRNDAHGTNDEFAALNQYALLLEITPGSSSGGSLLQVRASYDSRIISGQCVESTIAQWHEILQQLSKMTMLNSDTALKDISRVSSQDMDRIWRLNSPPAPAVARLVHDMISTVAKQNPDALALHSWNGKVRYDEFEKRTSILASELMSLGIGQGSFVPLLFEKSLWASVSMMAILKTGAAFVPLDPERSEGWLRAVMQRLNCKTIVCSEHTLDLAGRLASETVVADERACGRYKLNKDTVRSSALVTAKPSDLAYVIFTSGSTGNPKGVKITHTNLASALLSQPSALGFQPTTRSLDSSSYAFDACIFNLFYTLIQGGCLCIPDDSSRKGNLGAFMREFEVNLAQLTPSVARTLDPTTLPDLKRLILTGEPLTKGDIATWAPHLQLTNVYGPTECTIMCSAALNIVEDSQSNNVGSGLGANLWLTELGNPSLLCPMDGVGEIVLEGPLTGAGYLDQDKTKESSLLLDPPWLASGWEGHPGRRGTLFRTGDMARYADDGTLVFIGRNGSEVKIRGQRVDLADVEDCLRQTLPKNIELAAEVVHMAQTNDVPRQILLLFVSPVQGHPVQYLEGKLETMRPAIHENLSQALAEHMRPKAFVVLDVLPTTSSQKIDRLKLKQLGARLQPSQLKWIGADEEIKHPTPPATKMEKELASLWGSILRVEPSLVSREDSFFTLGGDSIAVMRLATIAHEHGYLITPKDVFNSPKLKDLAATMTSLSSCSHAAYSTYSLLPKDVDLTGLLDRFVLPKLNVSAEDVLDVVPANEFQIDCLNSQDEPLGLQYAYLDIGSHVNWERLTNSCKRMVQAFECLRVRFIQGEEGTFYQVVLRHAPVTVEEIHIDENLTSFCNAFCTADTQGTLLEDVLTKITLVVAPEGRRRVILRLSHAQNDGWCTEQIFRALEDAYNSRDLKPTPSFSQVLHHRNLVSEESREYWKSLLRGAPSSDLPLIHKPGQGVRTLRTISLPRFEVHGKNLRVAVVLNVAWALVLSKLTGQSDVVFGNVTTGRNGDMAGLHEVVGPCVNMVPFRLTCEVKGSTDCTWTDGGLELLLAQSARQVEGRMPYEGLDWSDVVSNCTEWPVGCRYRSSVHFRNMEFYPKLEFADDYTSNQNASFTVAWNEVIATPRWTTLLAYPEDDSIRVWLLANPAEIGDSGADELLEMIATFTDLILRRG